MVKSPKARHSRVPRNSLTIDLRPDEVTRAEETGPHDEETVKEESPVGEKMTGGSDTEPLRDPSPEAANMPLSEEQSGESVSSSLHHDQKPAPVEEGSTEPAGSAARPTATVEPARRGASAGPLLLAGVVGGAIALAGAGLAQYAGLLAAPGTMETKNLRSEIAELGRKITDSGSGVGDTQALDKVLSESSARLDDLAARLEKTDTDLGNLRAGFMMNIKETAPIIQAIENKAMDLQNAIAELQSERETDFMLDGRIAAVESAANAARSATEAAAVRLAGIERQVAEIDGRLKGQTGQSRAALVIAASGLKAAIERGGAFSSELEVFAAIAPDAPELEQLRPIAEKGVSSQAGLVAAMPAAANAMVDAAQVLNENAGLLDRLSASARSLVKIRPTGAVEGAGAPETVARMEAAVSEGNLRGALAEYDSLPEASRAAAAGFADSLRLRIQAGELADKALAAALNPA